MTDEQISRRKAVVRSITISVFLLVLAAALGYFRFITAYDWNMYKTEKAQEVELQSQIDNMTTQNSTLSATIDETGKQLVSFSEDKLKYINLASTLSVTHKVQINKLTVSDTWTEGQMSGMTSTIEVQGMPSDVQAFVLEYCSSDSANRVNAVSYRPTDEYVWVKRDIDDSRVLSWFDLGDEHQKYDQENATQNTNSSDLASAAKEQAVAGDGSFVPKDHSITLAQMFQAKEVKAYLVVDFLGRA